MVEGRDSVILTQDIFIATANHNETEMKFTRTNNSTKVLH